MNINGKLHLGGLMVAMLWLPGTLWAACDDYFAETNAVSVYSLSGQGNFTCTGALNLPNDVSVELIPDTPVGTVGWSRLADEVDAFVVQDANGKRCVYNYGPGATGGVGLTTPSGKPYSAYLACADDRQQPLPNTAPEVTITSPSTNEFGEVEVPIPGGEEITFTGTADDDEGDLSGSLAWSSSIDGPLGTGSFLMVSHLSAGKHTITAQVTDNGDPGLIGSDSILLTVEPIVVQQCQPDVGGVFINGVRVECPTGDEPRLVCSADLGDDADKFEIDSTACCLCNATATECDPNKEELPVGEVEPDGEVAACPETKTDSEGEVVIGGLQVPTTIMLNNDPYYCYTVGGKRTCFYYNYY